ncbi:DUF1430 domain-containing protein, partial [Streptococcus pneumoniae]|uniref:DUF1430 domain-containing protein n=1 Tax=Streptococcus pneumoniae TaxID=1313 RepID=UPI000AF6B2FD
GENPVSTQYLTDPILVVFTPTSTGDSFISLSSWSINAGKQLFIKGYESGQFRRDILIKRISGLRFFETHAQYMVSQFASFVFGASLFILSSRDLVIGLLTLLVFLASAVLTLYRQAQKESRVSMTIMKGK